MRRAGGPSRSPVSRRCSGFPTASEGSALGRGLLGLRVGELQEVADRRGTEDRCREPGRARREDETEREAGCDPLPDAEPTGDQLTNRLPHPFAFGLLVELTRAGRALELGEWGTQWAHTESWLRRRLSLCVATPSISSRTSGR